MESSQYTKILFTRAPPHPLNPPLIDQHGLVFLNHKYRMCRYNIVAILQDQSVGSCGKTINNNLKWNRHQLFRGISAIE